MVTQDQRGTQDCEINRFSGRKDDKQPTQRSDHIKTLNVNLWRFGEVHHESLRVVHEKSVPELDLKFAASAVYGAKRAEYIQPQS